MSEINGTARKTATIVGVVVTVLTLGVSIGLNWSRIGKLEAQGVETRLDQREANTELQKLQIQVAVMQAQISGLSIKIDQLQGVVIETRNAVIRSRP